MNILLGVSGSISAYRSCDIANELTKKGHSVKVVLTEGGAQFITPLSLEMMSKNRVYTDLFDEPEGGKVQHIELIKWADVFLIAPATTNIIGKIAHGIADNMLTAMAMALKPNCHKLIAPAMNTNKYNNPIMQENLKKLISIGYKEIEPRESLLACGDFGKGAIAEISTIVSAVEELAQ